jgi:hypothetical protein
MWDRHDLRSTERRDRCDPSDRSRGSRGGTSERDHNRREPRDVFVNDVNLPRGHERELVHDRDRVYEIDGSESRMLATIGAFRVVSERDLDEAATQATDTNRVIRHLEQQGLVCRSPLTSDDRAIVLTKQGRDLLEANRYQREDRAREPRQTFYSGLRKPRELTHDTKVYRAYRCAEERLRTQGGQVKRVVLSRPV